MERMTTVNINRQARRVHQARWPGVAAGVASLAVILGLAVAGTSVATTSAAAPQHGMSAASDGPAGGISVPVD